MAVLSGLYFGPGRSLTALLGELGDARGHAEMVGEENVVRLLERRFEVKVPIEDAWAHLGKVEQWPSWARHIRRMNSVLRAHLSPRAKFS